MTTFLLIPGAGGSSWYWHRVAPLLVERGHDTLTPDLPSADPAARFADYVDAVVEHAGGATAAGDLVVVGQSMGALIAPVVAGRVGAHRIVLVAPMIAAPGESGGEWWSATGQPDAMVAAAVADGRSPDELDDPVVTFLHDLPDDVRAEALARPTVQTDAVFLDPWPLDRWPDIPTRVVAGRHDRLFPLSFVRHLSRERLGIEPDVVDTGHLPALADPAALTDRLLASDVA